MKGQPVCLNMALIVKLDNQTPHRRRVKGNLLSPLVSRACEGCISTLRDYSDCSTLDHLNAIELDKQVLEILKTQVLNTAKFINVGVVGKYQPEIDALLKLILWKVSKLHNVYEKHATVGQQLLRIKYARTFNKRSAFLWALFIIGSKYIHDRSSEIKRATRDSNTFEWIPHILNWTEKGVRVVSFVNLLVFMLQGRYPTLVDRLLSHRIVSSGGSRNPDYQFTSRELVWHSLNEVLSFVVPLINYSFLRRQANYEADPEYECPVCDYPIENMNNISPATTFILDNKLADIISHLFIET
uniref:RING-type E3 ubiquitin transferase (cysteine targeting) n=1 Tax=Timema californicum TaxID=61474 RepID=A0A7R9J3T5_TIMCA|nr:unnamed protein product [Timema californicum]